MNVDRLVAMANDIANFFAADPGGDAAVAAVAQHLRRFWDPRMRQQIIAHHRAGGSGLSELAMKGVGRLASTDTPQPRIRDNVTP
jgi:formate dehydrogenase subunit delta